MYRIIKDNEGYKVQFRALYFWWITVERSHLTHKIFKTEKDAEDYIELALEKYSFTIIKTIKK